jgi:hypothetical protein
MASNISRKSNLKYSINGAFTQGTVSDEIADFLLAIKKKKKKIRGGLLANRF